MRVDSRLLVGMDDKGVENFKAAFASSDLLLPKVREILQRSLDAIRVERLSRDDFTDASWPYKQAYLNGREAEMTNLLALLTPAKG